LIKKTASNRRQPADVPNKPENVAPDKSAQTEQKPELDRPQIAVGDLIRVGGLGLEKPARVRAIQHYEGHPWVFISENETGIPMEQCMLEKKGQPGPAIPASPPRLPLKPRENKAPEGPGIRQEVFPLDEGDLVISYPENLSLASCDDLDTYLQLFLRKAKRHAAEKRKWSDLHGTPPEDRC
jgi:hypothetical protein